MKVYIEIRAVKGNETVKRIDVTGKSYRTTDTIEHGMNRNLNHKEYFTKQVHSEIELNEF